MRCSPLLSTFIVLLLCSFAVPRIVRSLVLKSSAQTVVSVSCFKFVSSFSSIIGRRATPTEVLIPRHTVLFGCLNPGSTTVTTAAARSRRLWLLTASLSSLTCLLVAVSVRAGIWCFERGSARFQSARPKRGYARWHIAPWQLATHGHALEPPLKHPALSTLVVGWIHGR